MPLNMGDANQALRGVLKTYGHFLPGTLEHDIRGAGAGAFVRILPQDQYRIHFNSVFSRFFAANNAQAFGLGRVIAPLGGGSIQDRLNALMPVRNAHAAIPCPAFCAPAVNVLQRKIYVNRDAPITIGTLYHEFIHFIQSSNFYPEFYSMGGGNPNLLEGVTEFFTRRISGAIANERAGQGKYQAHFNTIRNRIGNNGMDRMNLIRYSFQGGDYMNLGGVQPR
jgi:hypothetical protein